MRATTGDLNISVAPAGEVVLEGAMGSAAILETVAATGGRDINIGLAGARPQSLLLKGGTAIPGVAQSSSSITAARTLNVLVSGDVDFTGGSGSGALVQGTNVNIGSASAPVQNLMLAGGDATTGNADARIDAGQTVNVFTSGDADLKGATSSSALISGQTVNLSVGNNLALEGGNGPAGGALGGHRSDAGITASGALDVTVLGDLTMTGGSTDILSGAGPATSATALAKLEGANVLLTVLGDVVLTGGEAKAQAGGNTADSSVAIVATSGFNAASRITGDLTIQGGTANAIPASSPANAQSTAKLDVAGNLDLNVDGNLNLVGGTAVADNSSGLGAVANSTASLNATGTKDIFVGKDFTVTGGTARTSGAGATATALAGTDAGTLGFAGTLDIRTVGNMTVSGGFEDGAGIASAAILAAGEINVTVQGPQGLRLEGGGGTNLFQLIGGKLIEVEGKGYPITITGLFRTTSGLALGDAFFISGAPPLTLTDPQLLRSLDCVAISGGSCVIPASGSRAGDPSKLAAGGTCK
jgi:hypothetical protein